MYEEIIFFAHNFMCFHEILSFIIKAIAEKIFNDSFGKQFT